MGRKQNGWVDLPVTEETAKRHGWRFVCLLSDSWESGYKEQYGLTPLHSRITADGVLMDFIDFEIGKVTRIVRYPQEGMTFAEVWRWLHTTPDAEEVHTKEAGAISK